MGSIIFISISVGSFAEVVNSAQILLTSRSPDREG